MGKPKVCIFEPPGLPGTVIIAEKQFLFFLRTVFLSRFSFPGQYFLVIPFLCRILIFLIFVSAFSFPDISLSRQTKKSTSKKQEFAQNAKKVSPV